jgi:hypothetical protein
VKLKVRHPVILLVQILKVERVAVMMGDDDSEGGWLIPDFLFSGIVEGQKYKLQKDPARYPSMVSLEVMLQGGGKAIKLLHALASHSW